MDILSKEFLDNIENSITSDIGRVLKVIEKNYAVRSRYLSKKNACKYANIDPKTLDKWLAKGLQISKIDGCFRIDVQHIDDFIAKYRLGGK